MDKPAANIIYYILIKSFPAVNFYVKPPLDDAAGGWVNISWKEGPTIDEVREIIETSAFRRNRKPEFFVSYQQLLTSKNLAVVNLRSNC